MATKTADCVGDFLQRVATRRDLLLRRETLASPSASPDAVALAGFAVRQYLWPQNHTLRVYCLEDDYRAEVERHLAAGWARHVNLTFRFVDGRAGSDVRVSFRREPGRFWSLLGTQAADARTDEVTMSLGFQSNTPDKEIKRLVLHEFGHALGLQHEMKHPDAGIVWNQPKAIAYYSQLLPGLSPQAVWDQLRLLEHDSGRFLLRPFDPKSIMMYPIRRDLLAADSAWNPDMARWNFELSQSDIDIAREMYPPSRDDTEDEEDGGSGDSGTDAELEVDGDPATDAVGSAGEVDVYRFTIKRPGGYEVYANGDADLVLTVDGPNARGRQANTLSRAVGASYAGWFVRGEYTVEVRASGGDGAGSYSIGIRRYNP